MQYSEYDDCSTTLRDTYGFPVSGHYVDLYRQFAPVWAEEEEERADRWDHWLQSYRDLQGPSSACQDDAQLLERALSQYTAGTRSGSGSETAEVVSPHAAALLQQLRALVQMGVPMSRRAQFWAVFLDIKSKAKEGEYRRLVTAALAHEPSSIHGDQEAASNTSACHSLNRFEAEEFSVTPLSTSSESTSEEHGTSGGTGEEQDSQLRSNAPLHSSTSTPNQEIQQEWLIQIDKDLHRTFPDHPIMNAEGRAVLRRILAAYAVRNPEVGYCQGENFLAAAFMILFNEEDAFWCLAAVMEDLLPGYFDARMVAPQVDGQAFAHLLRGALPRVADHLEALQVDIPSATSAWFLVAFLNSLPLESSLRVWDVFFFERSAVVLFRVALALVDIYSQALLETDDSSEAYLLMQALGPMSYDASRLVDSACIGYGHVKDAALRVLRDKYRPEVMQSMESMFSCDEELQMCFEAVSAEAAAAPLSRSQSFAETLAAREALGLFAAETPSPIRAQFLDTASSLAMTNQSKRSPSARSSRAGTPIPDGGPSGGGDRSTQAAPSLSPFIPVGQKTTTPNTTGKLQSSMKSPIAFRANSPVMGAGYFHSLPRRTRSAALLGVQRRISSSQSYLQQRIDLHALTAFVPDLSHPKVAALYKIASKPGPLKKVSRNGTGVSTGSAASRGGSRTGSETGSPLTKQLQGLGISELGGLNLKGPSRSSLALSALLQMHEKRAGMGAGGTPIGAGEESGATIDIGSLAGLIKALKYGHNAEMLAVSVDANGGNFGGGMASPAEKKVFRRFTDGGALLKAAQAQLQKTNNNQGQARDSPVVDPLKSELPLERPHSPGTNREKVAQLQSFRDGLAEEVEEGARRQAAAVAAAAEAVATAEALQRQLTKVQGEIDEKVRRENPFLSSLGGLAKLIRYDCLAGSRN